VDHSSVTCPETSEQVLHLLDEVRVSKVARDALDWIGTEYNKSIQPTAYITLAA